MISSREIDIYRIENLLKKYDNKVPGIAVMAIKCGKIIFKREYGLANLEHNIPIKANTIFNIASISKQFTAMAIMILVEKGYLQFDDSITNFLPELSHYCSMVTIRNLLNNNSGIENYYTILERIDKSPNNISNKEVYNLLIKEDRLIFEPGTHFDYSNSNFVLLAMIIEIATKVPYKVYLKENIFQKIGMRNTMIFDEKQPIVLNRAYGYRKDEKKYYCDYSEALTVGDGGIFSTIEDLYLWDQVLYTEKLISRKTMELAFTSANGKDGCELEEKYGFGWSIKEESGAKIVWHSGLDAGFRSVITRYLSKQFTVIILSNSTDCTWPERNEITTKLFELYN